VLGIDDSRVTNYITRHLAIGQPPMVYSWLLVVTYMRIICLT